jgi:CMP-2-keto-3-deoxyoctulosonic acid synthetase
MRIRLVTALLAAFLLAMASSTLSCGGALSSQERQQLDALDASGVVRTYLETTDFRVVYYLAAPELQSGTNGVSYAGEHRHKGDIRNLVVDGPYNIQTDHPLVQTGTNQPVVDEANGTVTEMFTADYYLVKVREAATEEPGQQVRFIEVTRQSPNSPWRVLEIGTGP